MDVLSAAFTSKEQALQQLDAEFESEFGAPDATHQK
jgi:hypothetical protein